jgi:Uma2 family endonuclease
MKLVLCIFEQLSGLKINFHKIEIFALGMPMKKRDNINNFLGVNLVLSYSSILGYQFTLVS